MEPVALRTLLTKLIKRWEDEVIEFKRAGDGYSTSDIGKYFSALANEANLRGEEKAWLVFGVDDKSRAVVGTDYRPEHERLQSLKMQIAGGTEPSITLREIHELHLAEGRVLLFEIPAAPEGMPIAWQGHYYARAGQSLTNLGLDKQDAIRRQSGLDWSAQAVPDATLAHLDAEALQRARELFAQKHTNRFSAEEVSAWDTAAFLDRAKLTRDGRITRAALLLLGKPESAHFLSPHPAQITWRLQGPERGYEHFGTPFLLSTSLLYQKIRNTQLRILPDNQLVALEVAKYDRKIVLEALHNCIAHQDYLRGARIVVTETIDRLVFENSGAFFDGAPGDYVTGNRIPQRYRNPFLAQAMAGINMIDTMGYGIHAMFTGQARRYFPLPDYDLTESKVVRMTLHGALVDPGYSRMLIQKTGLPLADILALDRVQKKLPLDAATARRLRSTHLIEGRRPNLYVSAAVAITEADKAGYIRTRAQDDTFYEKLVGDYLTKFGSATRKEIDKLLWDKLSDALSHKQRVIKISNLLARMREVGAIENQGGRKSPHWVKIHEIYKRQ